MISLLNPEIQFDRGCYFYTTKSGNVRCMSTENDLNQVNSWFRAYLENPVALEGPGHSFGHSLSDGKNIYGLCIDIDAKKQEEFESAQLRLTQIRTLLDEEHIQYALETREGQASTHIWILAKEIELSNVDSMLEEISKKSVIEVFPKISNGKTSASIRLPGIYKDTSGAISIDYTTREELNAIEKIENFLKKAENSEKSFIQIVDILRNSFVKWYPREIKKRGRKPRASLAVESSSSIAVHGDELNRLLALIKENFEESLSKPGTFNFNSNVLHSLLIRDSTKKYLPNLSVTLNNWLDSVKPASDNTEDINGWLNVELYAKKTHLVKQISIFRNYDQGQSFIKFFDSSFMWKLDDFTNRLVEIPELSPIYEHIFQYEEFTSVSGYTKKIFTTFDFDLEIEIPRTNDLKPRSVIDFIDRKYGYKLSFKFGRSVKAIEEAYNQIVDECVQFYPGEFPKIFEKIIADDYPYVESAYEDLLKVIHFDTGKISKEMVKKICSIILKRAAARASVYLPRTEKGITNEKIKSLIKNRQNEILNFALVVVGPPRTGKTTLCYIIAEGIIKALERDNPNNRVYSKALPLFYHNGALQIDRMDIFSSILYATTTILDEFSTSGKDGDLIQDKLAGFLTSPDSGNERFAHDRFALSEQILSLFVGFTTDRQTLFRYKPGNARRFLMIPCVKIESYNQKTEKLMEEKAKAAVSYILRSYMKEYCLKPSSMEVDFLNDSQYEDVKLYSEGSVSEVTKVSPVVEDFEEYLVGSHTKELAQKCPIIATRAIKSNVSKDAAGLYSESDYIWIKANTVAELVRIFARWKDPQTKLTVNEDSSEVARIAMFLKTREVEKKDICVDGKTKKAYYVLMRTPQTEVFGDRTFIDL